MEYVTNLSKLKKSYPTALSQALNALRSSASKYKASAEKDMSWSWSLGERIDTGLVMSGADVVNAMMNPKSMGQRKTVFANIDETLCETDPQSYCDQMIDAGRFLVMLACQGRYHSEPLSAGTACPAEIVETYRMIPEPAPAPGAHLLHVYVPSAVIPGIQQYEIVGGYEKDGVKMLMDSESILHEMDTDHGAARWGGGLVSKALESFEACAKGAVFRYRNKALLKMTDAEISASVAAHPVWIFGMPGSSRAVAKPTIKPFMPVYAPKAKKGAAPIGTAGSLGLL